MSIFAKACLSAALSALALRSSVSISQARVGPHPPARALAGAAAPRFPPAAHALPVETLRSVGAIPAHIAGRFEDVTACQQSASGDYLVFDRRSHSVFSVAAGFKEPPKTIVSVGVEPGRVLRPSAFDAAPDGTFAVADMPAGTPRVQIFLENGARVAAFTLAASTAPLVTLHGVVVSGVASLEYTGKTVLLSQPERGALITELSSDGRPLRSFGTLRRTGHEQDRDVHIALNTGRIVTAPAGGFYFVFLSGVPLFQKYDAAGDLVFERHIEGPELDVHLRQLPTTWPRRTARGEFPLVMPSVRAAEADRDGNLWVSLITPYTYVYDSAGEKRRTVEFRAAGIVSASGFFFTKSGRALVTPGCYSFESR